jgi:hypothetical protein
VSSSVHTAGLSGGFVIGALQQLINELTARLRVPGAPVLDVPTGDVLEPRGDSQRSGANAVESIFDVLSGGRRDIDPQAARERRQLLKTVTVAGGGAGSVTRISIDADAPNADFGVSGRESAMVAIYVDGQYHSTAIVFGERHGAIDVNLGTLPPGHHQVELRAALDVVAVQPRVGEVRARTLTGEAALFDRIAPVLELRDTDRTPGSSVARSDVPLVLIPAVTRHADGSRTVEYRMVFSNEDGGTATPSLFAKYGRGVDAEPIYRVELDPQGRVVEASYQAALHRWVRFDGDRIGERAVLRVSTANNMVSARTGGAIRSERWSDAPLAPVADSTSEYDAMRANPWTWKVMSKELLREGRAAAEGAIRGERQVADPRRYVYLGPLDDAMRAAIQLKGGLELVLANGRHVIAKVAAGFAAGKFRQSALELPPGATADAIRGVALLGVRALVLDEKFGIRELARAA